MSSPEISSYLCGCLKGRAGGRSWPISWPIQRLLPGPGFRGRPRRGLLLLWCAVDLIDDQPDRLVIDQIDCTPQQQKAAARAATKARAAAFCCCGVQSI
ncbi:hypothetical protein MAHJHV57_54060 [Mycobacterium avium subsp. hominissuis]